MTAKKNELMGDWRFELSSGFAGWRCSKCACWVYADENKKCRCDWEAK